MYIQHESLAVLVRTNRIAALLHMKQVSHTIERNYMSIRGIALLSLLNIGSPYMLLTLILYGLDSKVIHTVVNHAS